MAKEYEYNIEEVRLTGELLHELERAYEDNRSSDILFFQQPSRFCELRKEAFKKECAIIQKNIKDVELARSFLEELQAMKEELCQILKERGENIADYVKDGYDSDFENDYSNEELVEYLASYGIESIEARHQAFMRDFRTNLTVKIGFITSKSASNEPISPTLFMKLFYKAYKITQKNRTDAFRKEQAFINDLSSYYQEDFTTIMTRVGQPELLSTQDCLDLLATIPTLKQYALGHYSAIGHIPTNYANLAHISGLVLQAITRSISHPIGRTVQLNYLTELKKRMHKLTVAIQQTLIQQPRMLEYYTLNQ